MPVWARCFNSLMRTGVSDLPSPKFDVTLVQTHTFHNCHSCLFDTLGPRRYSTWVPHKDRRAIIFLSSAHTSKGSNELCVNRRQWIKRLPECSLKENKQLKRGRKQRHCTVCVNAEVGANGTIMLDASRMFSSLTLQKQLCFASFMCTAVNVFAWTSVSVCWLCSNTGEAGCSHLWMHGEHALSTFFTSCYLHRCLLPLLV